MTPWPLTLAGASIGVAAGASLTRRSVTAATKLAGRVAAAAAVEALVVIRLTHAGRPISGPVRRLAPRLTPVGRGLAIALPLVIGFASLFAAADPIFGRWLGSIKDVRFDLGDLPVRTAYIAVTTWIMAGLLWLAARGEAGLTPRSLGAAARSTTNEWPVLDVTEALTVLLTLDVLFGMFVALQVAYLFGGLDTLAASGLTYANYARRGFFELLAAAFFAGLIVAGMEASVRPRRRAYVAALLGLVALTGVVLGSAFLRLRLYQEAYGWTELRFYVLAAIGFLALSLVAAASLIARGRSRWLGHAIAAAALIVIVAINVVGPQAFVTDRNLERAIDPSLIPPDGETALDTSYLAGLGADAVPGLVAAIPALGEPDRSAVIQALQAIRRRELDDPRGRGWPAWNLARERARAALAGLGGP